MKAFFAGICLFFSTLVSCQQKGEDFESVSTDEFATLIADPDIQRLDVRTVAEYSEEHILGSININVLDEQFAVIADSTLQKDKPIALYCRSGKRSKKAATILGRERNGEIVYPSIFDFVLLVHSKYRYTYGLCFSSSHNCGTKKNISHNKILYRI